jgi:DNA polymerase III subunit epsilon
MWGLIRRLFDRQSTPVDPDPEFVPLVPVPGVWAAWAAANPRPSLPPQAPQPAADAPSQQVKDWLSGTPPIVAPTRPLWAKRMPEKILFVDVETTGFHSTDRIVTLAGILLRVNDVIERHVFFQEILHLIVDPGKKSHPKAEMVHGYSDWVLRHQDPFEEHVAEIADFLNKADLIVAHNAEFDLDFINRELALHRKPLLENPIYCTMEAHRASGRYGSASLKAVAAGLGLSRNQQTHGALEDAWLAMMVYLAQHGCPHRTSFSDYPHTDPTNMKPVPPMPEGPLPRRKRRKKPQTSSGEAETASI